MEKAPRSDQPKNNNVRWYVRHTVADQSEGWISQETPLRSTNESDAIVEAEQTRPPWPDYASYEVIYKAAIVHRTLDQALEGTNH